MFGARAERVTARLLPYGDHALLVEVGAPDAGARHHAVTAVAGALRTAAQPPTAMIDVVPADATVLVTFATPQADQAATRAWVSAVAEGVLSQVDLGPDRSAPGRTDQDLVIPVVYDGPDLPDVARHTGLSVAEVVRAHREVPWTVAFCGFTPGFGYLVGGDPRLAVPRRLDPRTAVPAGAVGLAGDYCGIYPQRSPGGWQIIGRTDLPMFDPDRAEPALLRPGRTVRFVEVAG